MEIEERIEFREKVDCSLPDLEMENGKMLKMYNGKKVLCLTSKDLGALFGAKEDELVAFCEDEIAAMDFRYCKLEGEERDQIIMRVLKHIDSEELPVAGQKRRSDWKTGWGENLQEFIDSGFDVQKLVPKYFKKNVPVRLNRDYIMPVDEDFVLNVTKVFRSWLFQQYFQEVESIYEFGCGSGFHLAFLSSLYPEKRLYGFDWVEPSQEIIRLLAERYGWSIRGDKFDFFHPNESLRIESNSAVFTFGALEQIGKNHEPFLNFLLRQSPELCVNIEGINELYEEQNLLDYLSLKYHKRRKYLEGYLTRLRELEKERKVEIIKVHHQLFGNLFDDPHSYVVWKPRK